MLCSQVLLKFQHGSLRQQPKPAVKIFLSATLWSARQGMQLLASYSNCLSNMDTDLAIAAKQWLDRVFRSVRDPILTRSRPVLSLASSQTPVMV